MTQEKEVKNTLCVHHLKCIYCKKEFSPLGASAYLPKSGTQSVLIINKVTNILIAEPKKKKPNFFHKLLHHFIKNF